MSIEKIFEYMGLGIVILIIIYLVLRVTSIVHSVDTEEVLLGFAGGQALLDISLIRSISKFEGKMSLIERKLKI